MPATRKRPSKYAKKVTPPPQPPPKRTEFVATDQDRATVALCKAMGLTDEVTARQVRYDEGGITVTMLRRKFRRELLDSGMRSHLRVGLNMFNIATNPAHKQSVLAGMFWLKSRLNWQRDDTDFELKLKRKNGFGELPAEFTLKIGDAGPQGPPDMPTLKLDAGDGSTG